MQQRVPIEAPDPTRGLVRLLRGIGVGTSAVAVSLAGHVAGHGAMPAPTTLLSLLVVAAVVAWALSVARWTVTSLVGILLAAQSVLHLVFTLGAAETGGHLTPSMLSGHLVATAVMVAVLVRGEDLVWRVVESLGLRALRLLRAATLPLRPTVPMPAPRRRAAAPRCWHGSQPPRRGPPVVLRTSLVIA